MARGDTESHGGSPVIALTIGLIGLAFSVWIFALTGPYRDGITTSGKVLFSERAGRMRLVFHQSEVEFIDSETGEPWVITSEVGSLLKPDPGDTRRVSYQSGDPAGGRVLEGRVFVWIFAGMSLMFLGPSVHVLFKRLRSRRAVPVAT